MRATGPLFDGRAARAGSAMRAGIVEDVAQEAFHEVGAALDAVLQNPTGYYESRITTDVTADRAVVHDSGVIYGPWLAGVSSRNQRSRFKGYAHWQRARQRAAANVIAATRSTVAVGVGKMNR